MTLDPARLDAASEAMWNAGIRILQGNRLGATDQEHVARLLTWMAPPVGARIIDAGCGFGEVSRLMLELRPDLAFALVNHHRGQMERVPLRSSYLRITTDLHGISQFWPPKKLKVDGAMLLYTLCQVDPAVVLRELAACVRPGGFLFIYDYARRREGGEAEMQQHLAAAAWPWSRVVAWALDAGWTLDVYAPAPGDDSLFRQVCGDDVPYDTIFAPLMPSVWRFTRLPAGGVPGVRMWKGE